MRSRLTAPAVLALLAAAALGACSGDDSVGEVPAPAPSRASTASGGTASGSTEPSPSPAPRNTDVPGLAVEVVTGGLQHGWDIGFLPDGKVLVTERPGRISLVSGLRKGAALST